MCREKTDITKPKPHKRENTKGHENKGPWGREYKTLGKKTQLLTPATVSKRFHQNRTSKPESKRISVFTGKQASRLETLRLIELT